jgi:GH24 family phage-related lysozyme (muramidase)
MAANYHLSSEGYAELAKAEGNIPFIYDDLRTGALKPLRSYEGIRGTPTIGLGVAIQSAADREKYAVFLTRNATPEELRKINDAKLAEFEAHLNRRLDGIALTQPMFDALFSFQWNVGPYSKHIVQAVEALRAGDYAAAQQVIANGPKTSKGILLPALAARRLKEAALFAREGLTAKAHAAVDTAANSLPMLISVFAVSVGTFFLVRRITR